MPKFTLVADHAVDLFSPGGRNDSMTVQPDADVEIAGDLVTDRKDGQEPLPDDAYIVARNGEEKSWPKALWLLVEEVKKPAPAAPVKEK